MSILRLLHMLADGVATILCCCAKLVFMLFTIDLWHRAGLLKLWVVAPNRSRNVILGLRSQLVDKSDITIFVKFTRKLKVGRQ